MTTPRLEKKERKKPEPRPTPALVLEMQEDPFLTPAEIAEMQKVDPKTVTRWCAAGKFGEAPDVIRLPSGYGHRRIRTSAYNRAIRKVNDQ